MRPKPTTSDLPTLHKVKIHIHNQFVKHMASVKEQIMVNVFQFVCDDVLTTYIFFMKAAPGKVSITENGWSADTTKMSFQGMTAHWIEVKDGKWKN
jgi:hypothetical protein